MTAVAAAARMSDRVREESRQLDPAKAILTVLFLAPFLVGWLLGAVWIAVAWTWTAAVVGFRTAAGRDEGREGVPG